MSAIVDKRSGAAPGAAAAISLPKTAVACHVGTARFAATGVSVNFD